MQERTVRGDSGISALICEFTKFRVAFCQTGQPTKRLRWQARLWRSNCRLLAPVIKEREAEQDDCYSYG